MSKRTAGYTALYAILRLDPESPTRSLEERITVTKIVLDHEEAQQEVERLSRLNGEHGCTYFCRSTRLHGRLSIESSSHESSET